jgi:acetoin utilization deacetylase AcuC-like enzyme
MISLLKQLCPRIVVVLEGGYNLKAIQASTEAVARALLGEGAPVPPKLPQKVFRECVNKTMRLVELPTSTLESRMENLSLDYDS